MGDINNNNNNAPPNKRQRLSDEEQVDNENNDDNSNTENNEEAKEIALRKQRKRAMKLKRELEDLSSVRYPGDDNYQDTTVPVKDNVIQNDDDNDGDGANNDDGNDDDDDDESYRDPNDPDGINNTNPSDLDRINNPEEEEGQGEDLLENAFRDYQRIEALDVYGTEGIDDKDYGDMNVDERRAAEEELQKREDAKTGDGRSSRFYDGLHEDGGEDDLERRERRDKFRSTRRRKGRRDGDDGGDDGYDSNMDVDGDDEDDEDDDDLLEADDTINLEAFDVPLKEWISQDRTRREVQRKFRKFLKTFREADEDDEDDVEGKKDINDDEASNSIIKAKKKKKKKRQQSPLIYEDKIKSMCASNLATLEISYLHLMQNEPILAIWIADAPRDMLDVLDEAATKHVFYLFPSYGAIKEHVRVRVSDMPILDSIRSLRRVHLDKFVRITGVITRRTTVLPKVWLAYYACVKCKSVAGPFKLDDAVGHGGGGGGGDSDSPAAMHVPSFCPSCDSAGPFRLDTNQTRYRNHQRVHLQETPGSVPPGRAPRTKEIVLADDLVDMGRPGEEVEITGIYRHAHDYGMALRSGFPVFSTYVEANHVRRKEDGADIHHLSEMDRIHILELSRDPNIGERIIRSIAPSIHGQTHAKTAIAVSLFGGVPKDVEGRHSIRGDINVLLLGDPGTAKSQLLKYAEATAPRAVYATGRGASAVGLTASVRKDPTTREWTLEGGALVLADRGVCLIDEFDKMNEQDRTSIHEAMEQQSISISKAGIVTSLRARCAVIAAANPIGGRYDPSCTLAENVELTDPILQRFDCLCVLKDVVDPVLDEELARFVVRSHVRSRPTSEVLRGAADGNEVGGSNEGTPLAENNDDDSTSLPSDLVPQDLLQKYVRYARANCSPVLRADALDRDKVESLYIALRRESSASGGVPVAVRHIESLVRMSEAHAKMSLRDYVRDDDFDFAIRTFLEGFLGAQKFGVQRQLRRAFSKFVGDPGGSDRAHLLLHVLREMMRNEAMYQTVRLRQGGKDQDEEIGTLEVPLEEFEGRARDRRIYNITDFCEGMAFQDAGYKLDRRRGVIMRDGIVH